MVVGQDLSGDGAGDAAGLDGPADVSAEDVAHLDEGPPPMDTAADLGGPGDVVAAPDGQPPEPDVLVVADGDGAGDGGQSVGSLCFPDLDDPELNSPDYDQFGPTVGSHCKGTNHQDIVGIDRVVFLGDSVTQGTPNLAHLLSVDNAHFFRNLLAEWLADEFDLDRGGLLDWGFWKTYDYFTGKGGKLTSGDFSNCAKWGARTDDLLQGNSQIAECFPAGGSDQATLIIFTMGGNDISKITQQGGEASPEEVAAGYPASWLLAETTIAYLEEAIIWLKDPARFPKGSYVLFANPFEFTDGTGQVDACSPQGSLDVPGIGAVDLSSFDVNLAELGGYTEWADPTVQEAIVIWMLEQFTRISVDHEADIAWLLEHFCGHGYVATGPDADPENRCYQGPDAELYFDETCIHPNPAGHGAIFDLFQALVLE